MTAAPLSDTPPMAPTQVLAGSALAALGVAAGSLLAPQAGFSLDFTFSFGGVTGLIEGLIEGGNTCQPFEPCRITVTNNGGTGAPVGPSHPYTADFPEGGGSPAEGFEVFTPNGGTPSIVNAFWAGGNGTSDPQVIPPGAGVLYFSSLSFSDEFPKVFEGFLFGWDTRVRGPAQFAVVSEAVPAPVPVFGAAAAFGYSRRLRWRLKGSSDSVTKAPFT